MFQSFVPSKINIPLVSRNTYESGRVRIEIDEREAVSMQSGQSVPRDIGGAAILDGEGDVHGDIDLVSSQVAFLRWLILSFCRLQKLSRRFYQLK